jgi:hypothetical protein
MPSDKTLQFLDGAPPLTLVKTNKSATSALARELLYHLHRESGAYTEHRISSVLFDALPRKNSAPKHGAVVG